MPKNIAECFNDYFDMLPATTSHLKESVYRLRYEVFCQEMGYWAPELYPDGMEHDEHDAHAEHYLIRHRQTGLFAATTRLVLAHPDDPNHPFPIEEHAKIDRFDLFKGVPRSQIAEASRFCVSGYFKRREGERHTPAGVNVDGDSMRRLPGHNQRHTLSNFSLPLLACLVRMSIRHGVTHWYAFMEPAFARLFQGMGIFFIPIGPLIEHCGKRRPYIIKLEDLLTDAKNKDIAEWDLLTDFGSYWHADKGKGAELADPSLPHGSADADSPPGYSQ